MGKPVKDDMSNCEEINVIQVKVLYPLDFDMVLEVGDELALDKLEKEVDLNNPDSKSYSDIKLEAEMRLAKEEDDRIRDVERECEDQERKRKNRKIANKK